MLKHIFFFSLFLISLTPSLWANPHTQEFSLTLPEQAKLLEFARLSYDGKRNEADKLALSPKIKKAERSIIASLFTKAGSLVVSRRFDSNGKSLPDLIHQAMAQSKVEFRKKRGAVNPLLRSFMKASGRSDPHEGGVFIHLMIESYRAELANFGIKGLFDNKVYEPHLTGLIYELDGVKQELNPIQSVVRNLGSKGARSHLAGRIKIDPRQMPARHDLKLTIYRVIHFGESYPDKKFVSFYRGHKRFTHQDVNHNLLLERLKLIGGWYQNNTQKGQVTYEFIPRTDKIVDHKRTMVRSTMAVWILNRLAFFLDDDKLKKLGEESLQFYLERYYQMKASKLKGELIPSPEPLANGNLAENRYTAASFLVASILERDELDKYKQEVDLIFNWLSGFKAKDGLLWTQYGQSQYFMPGQLLLTISYLYEKTKDQKYLQFFNQVFDAYEPMLYQMMHLGNKLYAPYAPAWFTQPLAKMYELTKQKRYRDMVFTINDRVAKWYPLNSDYEVYGDYDGILAPKRGHYGNNSITAASLESLVDAAIVAKLAGDNKRYQKYRQIIPHTVAYLLRLQFIPENTYYVKNRQRVMGGFKKDLISSVVWMDNVWHLTSAFMKIYEEGLLK